MANQIFDRDDPPCVPEPLPRHHMELLRRDWSVRVLDAWADAREAEEVRDWSCADDDCGTWYCDLSGSLDTRCILKGPTPDAARHAAALAVFPTLSAAKRAELGECP